MRLIDADELLPLYEGVDESLKVSLRVVKQNIKEMPTIEVEPRKHGRWMPYKDKAGRVVMGQATCSVCGGWYEHILCVSSELNYCPVCGSKMDEAK